MSETNLCINCKHYRRPIDSGFSPWPDFCAYSDEDSPVNGYPLWKVPQQYPFGNPSVLEIRQQKCKGEWFAPAPPEPAKPWWRFW